MQAIQGKLIKSSLEYKSALETVEKIRNERLLYIEKNSLRKESKLEAIDSSDVPYEIPSNWMWMKFGELGIYKKGPFGSSLTKSMFVPKSENTVKVYEQKNAIYKNSNIGNYYISKEYFNEKMKGFEVLPGDVIVSCAGTIGETFVMPNDMEKGIINQALMKMTMMKNLYLPYFLIYFDFILKQNTKKNSRGSALKNIPPFNILKNYLVPIPPYEEQVMIVNKVEELFQKVDEYDKLYMESTKINKKFPESIMKSILQHATKGKLTKQNIDGPTGHQLYEYLINKKNEFKKNTINKKQNNTGIISPENYPFDIPETWKWAKLGDIAQLKMGKTPARSENIYWSTSSNISWVSIADMVNNDFTKTTKETISSIGLKEKFDNKLSPRGTLLMSFKLTIGKVSILDIDAVHNEAIVSIYPYIDSENILRNYLFKTLPLLVEYANTKGAIKGKTLNSTSLNNIMIPLPSLQEQKIIVNKIKKLEKYVLSLKDL